MSEVVVVWYGWLSRLAQGPIGLIDGWIQAVNLPAITVVLFGLIGATSPCQLTTNLSALALGASQPGPAGALKAALAYASGKVAVYSVVGGMAIVLGLQLQATSIPVVIIARKVLGPLMVIVGLGMLGLLPVRGAPARALAEQLRGRLPTGGRGGAFLLGVAFSFAFCPTLFWLFFGLTLPLAVATAGGWSFPGLFALGTTFPLLVVAAAVGVGRGAAERAARGMARIHRAAGCAAGIVFVLAGLHDTLIYWWL